MLEAIAFPIGIPRTMVTLGCWAGDTSGTGTAYIRNSIVHELGHNLGLQHGGDETCNYKPNYSSVMFSAALLTA